MYIIYFQNCRIKEKNLQERNNQVEQPHEEAEE